MIVLEVFGESRAMDEVARRLDEGASPALAVQRRMVRRQLSGGGARP